MEVFNRTGLMGKFVFFVLTVTLIPVMIVGYLSFEGAGLGRISVYS